MKITFVFYECNNLGVEYLSSYLEKYGHETDLAFDPALFRSFTISNRMLHRLFDYKAIVVKQVIDSQPGIVGFSVVSDTYGWACEIAREIKKEMNVPVIFGGIHPTSVPEIVIQEDFVDYVCVGEGEEAMVELVEAIEKGKDTTSIKNIWAKKDGRVIENPLRPLSLDLNKIPFPDKEIFYKHYDGFHVSYNIITSRGCPHVCTFCYNSLMVKMYKGAYLRQRSVENVIDELRWAKEKYNIRRVFFVDDMFAFNKQWLGEFCHRYKQEIGLPFTCEIHPTMDEDIVELLVSAGCVAVDIGIQTISEDLRKNILCRYESHQQVARTIELFMKTNIYVYVDIMLGIPGQDEKELVEIIRFLNACKPDYVLINWLRYYPRTELVNMMHKKGYFSSDDVARIEHCKDYIPFTNEGNSFDSETGKLGNLILISQILPVFLIELIISKRLYRYINSSTYFPLRLYAVGISLFNALFSSKKRLLYFTPSWQLKYYAYWTLKKIFTRLFGLKKYNRL